MISKVKDPVTATDRFTQAGAAAEEQMAFYLRRAFGDDDTIFVFNDLRLVTGQDCAQIDHLVLHAFGMFIIESKSISGEVEVNQHGEWIRKWGRQRSGMPSPIQQAQRQAEFLRKLLDQHRESLRDKRLLGFVQAGFKSCPICVLVAISDQGIIKRRQTNPPEVMKADLICAAIEREIKRHRKAGSLLGREDGDYGLWKLHSDELPRARDFLLQRHTPLSPPPDEPAAKSTSQKEHVVLPPTVPSKPMPATAVCKHCGSSDLAGAYGRYGYYFKCQTCDKNTPIDYACAACGKKGRIRKSGPQFRRVCEACGHEELIWENRPEDQSE